MSISNIPKWFAGLFERAVGTVRHNQSTIDLIGRQAIRRVDYWAKIIVTVRVCFEMLTSQHGSLYTVDYTVRIGYILRCCAVRLDRYLIRLSG